MGDLQKVPVKFDGFEIGDGILSEDGKIVMIKLNDSGVGLEIQSFLQTRSVGSISINPRKHEG